MTSRNMLSWRARLAWVASWPLALAGFGGACGTTTGESSGETHFLSYCEQTCARGYECLCGVCTLDCDENAECAGAAVCRKLAGNCGSQVCDVGCESEADCGELGAEYRCVNGSCRVGRIPEPQCPEGCTLLAGYPEDPADRCLVLDAGAPGEGVSGVPVACTCGSAGESLNCFVRSADESLWLLPAADLEPAEAWRECDAGERERVASSCDFARCPADARPPSTCDFEATCEALNCGTSQYDEQGCLRASCEEDQDCASDEYCSTLYAVGLRASLAPDAGCGFGGDGGSVPQQFCRAVSPPGPLCDGTDEVRLFIDHVHNAFVSESFGFIYPYGGFLLVTGRCEYWAGHDDGGVLRAGSFSEAEAEQLETEIGWDSLEAWSSYNDVVACPDAGTASLQARAGSVSCNCGCDEDAPPELVDAMNVAAIRTDERTEQGDPAVVDVRVVSTLAEFPDEVPAEYIVSWPLERDVTEFAIDPLSLSRDSGERISDPDDAQALRNLRTLADFGVDPMAAFGEDGKLYSIWLRDELPPEVEESLALLLAAE